MVKLFHDVFKLTLEGKNFVITKLFTHSDDCLQFTFFQVVLVYYAGG